jgi:hypothetical protein
VLTDLRTVGEFDDVGTLVTPEMMEGMVRISADPARHVAWLREDVAQGFSRLFLHNVNREQERYIDDFGAHVLPALADLRHAGDR